MCAKTHKKLRQTDRIFGTIITIFDVEHSTKFGTDRITLLHLEWLVLSLGQVSDRKMTNCLRQQ